MCTKKQIFEKKRKFFAKSTRRYWTSYLCDLFSRKLYYLSGLKISVKFDQAQLDPLVLPIRIYMYVLLYIIHICFDVNSLKF